MSRLILLGALLLLFVQPVGLWYACLSLDGGDALDVEEAEVVAPAAAAVHGGR